MAALVILAAISQVGVQSLDALLSLEAGVRGMTKDALVRDLFFASLSSPIAV